MTKVKASKETGFEVKVCKTVPKGAILSHKNLVNNARLFCTRKRVGQHSVWANFMPLFHTAGCATGVLGCLQASCKMLLIKHFDANVFARLIEEQKVTTCFAVPTLPKIAEIRGENFLLGMRKERSQ